VNMGLDEPIVAEAAPARQNSPPCSPAAASKTNNSEWFERRRTSLMREVASHFPRLRDLLDSSLQDAPAEIEMPQGRIHAVGGMTMEVVSLISTLSRTGLDVILEAVLKHQLLSRCIEVFFRHPWSNLLHNAVKLLLSEVLSSSDGCRADLVRQLLQKVRFAERLVQEYSAEAEVKALETKPRHARVGYMGHVYNMCCELRDFDSAEVRDMLASTDGWKTVVLPALEDTKKIHDEQLGGGVPMSDRGLASSNIDMNSHSSAASTDFGNKDFADDDFVLDDPNDFEDEADSFSPPKIRAGKDFDDDDDDDDLGFMVHRRDDDSAQDFFDPNGSISSDGGLASNSLPSAGGGWADFSSFEPAASPSMEKVVPFASFPDDAPTAPAANTSESPWSSPSPAPSENRSLPKQPSPPASWTAQFDAQPEDQSSANAGSFWSSGDAFGTASESKQEAAQSSSESSARTGYPTAPAEAAAGGCGSRGSAETAWPPVSKAVSSSSTPTKAVDATQVSTSASSKPVSTSGQVQSSSPASDSLGAENLFALLGGSKPGQSQPKQPATSSTAAAAPQQWPLPPAAAASPPPPPWCAMPQGNLSATSPVQPSQPTQQAKSVAGHGGVPDPGAWVADFDPLAGGASHSQSGQPLSSDLTFLDLQWQSSGASTSFRMS